MYRTADPDALAGGLRGTDVNLRGAPQMLEYAMIADRVAADGHGSVLDWGCGWGQLTRLLADRGLDVTSFDYRPDLPTETVPLERFPGLEVDLSPEPVALPYASDRFDSVLSCGVLEHVAYPAASLAELRRVLKPGGTVYVYKLPNRFSYLEAIARVTGLYYHGRLEHDRLYTRRGAASLLEVSGFEVVDAELANLVPLTVGDRLTNRYADAVWRVNQRLARLPGLRLVATNVNVVGRASV